MGILMPQQQESTLDQVSKALSLIGSIYNIKEAVDKSKQMKADRDLANRERESAMAEKDRLARGEYTKGELISVSDKFDFSESKPKNAFAFEVKETGSGKTYFALPRSKGQGDSTALASLVYRMNRDAKEDALKAEEKAVAKQEKIDKLTVPELGVAAKTDDDAKKAKEAISGYKDLASKLTQMKSLRKEYGQEIFDTEAAVKMKSLAAQARIAYKKIAELGVLSKSDIEDFLDRVIPADPSSGFRDAPIMSALDTAMSSATDELLSGLKTRGLGDARSIGKSLGLTPAQVAEHEFNTGVAGTAQNGR